MGRLPRLPPPLPCRLMTIGLGRLSAWQDRGGDEHRRHAALVVGGAEAVEPPVSHASLQRIARPAGTCALGVDVREQPDARRQSRGAANQVRGQRGIRRRRRHVVGMRRVPGWDRRRRDPRRSRAPAGSRRQSADRPRPILRAGSTPPPTVTAGRRARRAALWPVPTRAWHPAAAPPPASAQRQAPAATDRPPPPPRPPPRHSETRGGSSSASIGPHAACGEV